MGIQQTAPLFDRSEIGTRSLVSASAEFPIKARRCYLNNASIGPVSTSVLAAVNAFLADVRDHGRNNYPAWCKYADQEVKSRVGRMIGAAADEIAFVKNTTEGLVIVANGLDWREGDNVVLPDIEYPSNVYCWMRLAKRGVSIRWVKTAQGRSPVDAIAAAMDTRTRLVSISAVQFSNGYRQDLALLSQLCSDRGVLLNLDAIQWLGALAMDVKKYKIDFMSAGGHKWLLSPIGTGVFYCNSASLALLDPPSVGYHSVDKHEAHMDYELVYRPNAGRFEEALVNLPGIWGLNAAVKTYLEVGAEAVEAQILDLRNYASEAIKQIGWSVVSPEGAGEKSGILSFNRPGLDPDLAAERLTQAGVDLAVRASGLRVSASYYNDQSDMDRLVEALRSLS